MSAPIKKEEVARFYNDLATGRLDLVAFPQGAVADDQAEEPTGRESLLLTIAIEKLYESLGGNALDLLE